MAESKPKRISVCKSKARFPHHPVVNTKKPDRKDRTKHRSKRLSLHVPTVSKRSKDLHKRQLQHNNTAVVLFCQRHEGSHTKVRVFGQGHSDSRFVHEYETLKLELLQ